MKDRGCKELLMKDDPNNWYSTWEDGLENTNGKKLQDIIVEPNLFVIKMERKLSLQRSPEVSFIDFYILTKAPAELKLEVDYNIELFGLAPNRSHHPVIVYISGGEKKMKRTIWDWEKIDRVVWSTLLDTDVNKDFEELGQNCRDVG